MPLTSLDLLAAIIPPLGAAHLGGLDRLTLNACGTGRGLASCRHPRPLAEVLDQPCAGPIVSPLESARVRLRPACPRSHRRATAQSSHRRYSWVANHVATYPIGSHYD